jgi:putative FmdB family regulatory protein
MPIYEFKCQECGNTFDELVSISKLDNNDVKCPECDSKNTKRQISAPSIGNSKKSCNIDSAGSGFT